MDVCTYLCIYVNTNLHTMYTLWGCDFISTEHHPLNNHCLLGYFFFFWNLLIMSYFSNYKLVVPTYLLLLHTSNLCI